MQGKFSGGARAFPSHCVPCSFQEVTFDRGCSQSGMCGFGVDSTPRGVQGSLPVMRFSSSGSFCHSSDSSSPSVCVTSCGSDSMETRDVLLPLGRSRSLRLSLLCSHPSRSGESSGFAVCTNDVGFRAGQLDSCPNQLDSPFPQFTRQSGESTVIGGSRVVWSMLSLL